MNLLSSEAAALATAVRDRVGNTPGVEVILCPVFTCLRTVADAVRGTRIAVGGQNCYTKNSGAFTGEISPQMLKDAGCDWVIIGHSERRQYFEESDEFLNQKARFALESGLKVMFCIGETLEERKAGEMEEVLRRQVEGGLPNLDPSLLPNLVIAYEPVWAIGTGETATPEQAQEAHWFVRGLVNALYNETIADQLRIQYGGSVKAENALELLSKPDVDGALVGGASLQADSFAAIVEAAVRRE
jgi:triosephosphate isomerase